MEPLEPWVNVKIFSTALLGFDPYCDHKHANAIHADFSEVYTSGKTWKMITIDKILLKCDVIGGSVVNGVQEPIFLVSY